MEKSNFGENITFPYESTRKLIFTKSVKTRFSHFRGSLKYNIKSQNRAIVEAGSRYDPNLSIC